MSKILTTKEIAVALDNIIRNAEKHICIFTFNLNIGETYLSRLRNASKRGVKIIVVFGVENGDKRILDSLLPIANCEVYFKPYLHAKFFYNEKELLIGSMNLSEASERNNYELAVLLNINENPEAILKVKREAREIVDDAIPWNELQKNGRSIPKRDDATTSKGICIRCQTAIPFNPSKPLCDRCYTEWSEWENDYYQEQFCHKCGKERMGISKAFPECTPCYKQKFSAGS